MSQRTNVRVSEETEEQRASRLADLSQRANVRVSEETCDERSHRLQVMRDLQRVCRSSESSEAREVRLQALRIHNQSTRACTTPVLTPPLTGEEQRRIVQLSKDLEKFRSEIIVSPSNSCFSCHRLTYLQGGSYETVEDLIAPLYSHPTTIPTSTADGGEGSPSTVPSSSSTTHSCKGYVVRKPKIMRALHWLKTSNILYADISHRRW